MAQGLSETRMVSLIKHWNDWFTRKYNYLTLGDIIESDCYDLKKKIQKIHSNRKKETQKYISQIEIFLKKLKKKFSLMILQLAVLSK